MRSSQFFVDFYLNEEDSFDIFNSKWISWKRNDRKTVCKLCLKEICLNEIKMHSNFCYQTFSLSQNIQNVQDKLLEFSSTIDENLSFDAYAERLILFF